MLRVIALALGSSTRMSSRTEPILDRALNWDDRLQCAESTDVGMRRLKNQDSRAIVLAADMDAWRDAVTSSWWPMAWEHTRPGNWPVNWPSTAYSTSITSTLNFLRRTPCRRRSSRPTGKSIAAARLTRISTTWVLRPVLCCSCRGADRPHRRQSRVPIAIGRARTTDPRPQPRMGTSRTVERDAARSPIPKNVITRSLWPELDRAARYRRPAAAWPGTIRSCSAVTGSRDESPTRNWVPSLALAPSAGRSSAHRLGQSARRTGQYQTVVVAKVVSDDLATVNSQPLKLGGHRGPAPPAASGVGRRGRVPAGSHLAGHLGELAAGTRRRPLRADRSRLRAGCPPSPTVRRDRLECRSPAGQRTLHRNAICPPERAAQMLKSIVRDLRGTNGENRSWTGPNSTRGAVPPNRPKAAISLPTRSSITPAPSVS